MDMNEFKTKVQERTGIPAALLQGESPEEVITYAKALCLYRKQSGNEPKPPRKSTAEQFAEWWNGGADAADDALQALSGGAGGADPEQIRPKTPADSFAEWASQMGLGR